MSRRTLTLIAAVAVAIGASTIAIATFRLYNQHQQTTASVSGPSGAVPTKAGTAASPTASVSCAAATVAKLTLEEQVGQLLMIGTPISDPGSIAGSVTQYHLGGVFLAGRSSQSAASLKAAVDGLQKAAGVPLQIALDQEGGLVQTLSGPDFPTIPTAVQQGKWTTQQLHDHMVDIATRLVAAGVTMDLAPVADTVPAGTAASNPPIGQLDRQFGSNPDTVATDISTVVSAVQGAGVVTTLKHFPGLGRVKANTDTSTNAVDNTTTTTDPYLNPFIAGIKAGTGAVMVSSAKYPKLDSQNIAAFSTAIITGLLRQKLGFTGVVISDDLGAAVAAKSYTVGDRAVRFITAGGDVVLTVRSSDAAPMSAALIAAAKQTPAFAARVTDAATHVIAGKVTAGLIHC